jgi:protocatechuate 3,4-dioxygenase beta subunit
MTIQFNEGETKELNVGLQPIPMVPASLVGQVVDADTSEPIPSVLVEILGLTSVATASDGTYSIIDIPPGSYTIRFSHPDYQTVEY